MAEKDVVAELRRIIFASAILPIQPVDWTDYKGAASRSFYEFLLPWPSNLKFSQEKEREIYLGHGIQADHTGNLVCGFKTLSSDNQPLALPFLRLFSSNYKRCSELDSV